MHLNCFIEQIRNPRVTIIIHFLSSRGSIFFRDSTNIQANPKPYPTMIKKEPDHLHITAPLNIYPEGNYELDDLGLSGIYILSLMEKWN